VRRGVAEVAVEGAASVPAAPRTGATSESSPRVSVALLMVMPVVSLLWARVLFVEATLVLLCLAPAGSSSSAC
jgi:hypothetical protein